MCRVQYQGASHHLLYTAPYVLFFIPNPVNSGPYPLKLYHFMISAHSGAVIMNRFVLRSSSTSTQPSSGSSAFQPPSSEQLLGKWFIVHTSLPFWRDKRNISIIYSALSSPARSTDPVNDIITYQTLNSEKLKTVQGINTVAQSEQQGA